VRLRSLSLGVGFALVLAPAAVQAQQGFPIKDFAAMSSVARGPQLLVVHPVLPSRSAKSVTTTAGS
jgi:tripartite-type tricarboxylate transporter receptor subunit TctC